MIDTLKYAYRKICLTQIPSLSRKINRNLRYRSNYNNMKQYKNIHLDERCFIIATGPSLTVHDLEMVKNEITFGMNSGIYLMDKSSWKPTYYIIQDHEVYNKIANDLYKLDDEKTVKFIGDTATQDVLQEDVLYTVNLLDHLMGGHKIFFSDDCFKNVADGWTVTYSAIQIAAYMGFTEIYLLGCDSNYMGKQMHASTCIQNGEKEERTKGVEFFKQNSDIAYDCANNYGIKNGIKIFNSTRGGMLEIFPRKQLEELNF